MAHQGWRRWFKRSKKSANANRAEEVRSTWTPRLEVLEDRNLLNAALDISAQGIVTFTGSAANNNLTLSLSGGTYKFADSADLISVTGAGAANFTGSGTTTVQGPSSAVAGLVLSLGLGADALELGPFDAPVAPLNVDGSGNSGDTLDVNANGAGIDVTAAGNVSLTGFSYLGVNNDITTANGGITMGTTGTLDVNAPLTASGNITLAAQTINVNADIATSPSSSGTTGNIQLTAGGSLALNENISTGNATHLDTAASDTALSGSIVLSAGNGIQGQGTVSTGNATIAPQASGGTDNLTSGSITLTASGTSLGSGIGLSTPAALEVGNVTGDNVSSSIAQVGSILLTSATTIDNGAGGMLDVAFGAATAAIGDLPGFLSTTTSASGGAAGEILISSATPLVLGPITTSGGNVGITTTTSDTPLIAESAINSGAGSVSLQAAGPNSSVTVNNSIQAGNGGVTLSATDGISLFQGSSIVAAGDFTAIADSDSDGNGSYLQLAPVSAENIAISGAGVLVSGMLTATGQAAVISTPSINSFPFDNLTIAQGSGGIVAPKGITLTASSPNAEVLANDALTAASGAIQIEAGNGVDIFGPVTAGGAFIVNAPAVQVNNSQGVFQNGPLQASSIQVVAADINLLGVVTSTGAVTLTAHGGQGIVTVSSITAGGAVNISANGSLAIMLIEGQGISTTGGISLTLSGDQTISSTPQGAPGAPLSAGAAGINIQSNGSVELGSVTTTGPFTASADTDFDGNGSYTQLGTVSATNITISGAGVQIAGNLAATGQVAVTSTPETFNNLPGNLSLIGATVVAPMGISLTAEGMAAEVQVNASLTASGGPVQILASNGVQLNNQVMAAGAFTVNARTNPFSTGAYTGNSSVQAGSVIIAAANVTQIAPITSAGAVTLTAQSSQSPSGSMALGPITAGGGVSATATQITATGLISTTGAINLMASGLSAFIFGSEGGPNGVVLSAGIAGIVLQSAGPIQVLMATTSGPFTAIADTDADGNGVYFQAGPVSASNILISGAGVQLGGGLKATGQATVISTPIQVNNGLGIFVANGSGGIIAPKGISLIAAGQAASLQIFDVLTASSGPVQLQASDGATLDANVTAGGAYTVNAQTNPFVIGALYQQSGAVKAASVLIVAESISLQGPLTSAGAVMLTARGLAANIFTGTITASGAVTITSTSSSQTVIDLNGAGISTTGGISLTANGPESAISGLQPGGATLLKAGLAGIQIQAAGSITVNTATTTGPYSATADSDSDGIGSYSQSGLVSAGNITISGAGVQFLGGLTATGQALVTSTTESNNQTNLLIIGGTSGISAMKGIFLTDISPGGNVQVTAVLTAKSGPIQIQASNGVGVNANVTAGAAYTVNALAGSVPAVIGNYQQSGAVVAASVNIVAGGISLFGPITSSGAVALQALQSFTPSILTSASAGISAGGAIIITAGGGTSASILLGGPLTSRTGAIALQALTGVTVSANITTAGAFTVNADSNPQIAGNYQQASTSAVRAASITLYASNLNLSGSLTAIAGGVNLVGVVNLVSATITVGPSFQVTISSNLTATGTSRIAGSLYLGNQTRTFTIIGSSDLLSVTGVVSGTPNVGVMEAGTGTLAFQNKDTYTGTTTLNGGTMLLTTTQATSSLIVNAFATLAGTGTLTKVVVNGGTVSPGFATTVGTLTTTGPVTFGPSLANIIPTFTVQITSTSTDLLKAGGTLNLGGAALNVVLPNNFTHVPGKKFTIITSAGLIGNLTLGGNTLNGGDTVTVGLVQFTISYVSGSVILTEQ